MPRIETESTIDPKVRLLDALVLNNRIRVSGMAYADKKGPEEGLIGTVNVRVKVDLASLTVPWAVGELPVLDVPLDDKFLDLEPTRTLFCPGNLGWIERADRPLDTSADNEERGGSKSRVRVDKWSTTLFNGGCIVTLTVRLTNANLEYIAFWAELDYTP